MLISISTFRIPLCKLDFSKFCETSGNKKEKARFSFLFHSFSLSLQAEEANNN